MDMGNDSEWMKRFRESIAATDPELGTPDPDRPGVWLPRPTAEDNAAFYAALEEGGPPVRALPWKKARFEVEVSYPPPQGPCLGVSLSKKTG